MDTHIAIIVQNVIQWYSIRKLAIFLKEKKNLSVDIYLYNPADSSAGFHDIANDTANAILSDNFTPLTKPANYSYKICLAPYSNMIDIDCKYRLGFCYGAATTKPKFTLDPSVKIGFHGLFLHDTYGAEIFSVYGKVYIVPDLYIDKITKHISHTNKPTVLYLPTYHEPSTIQTASALSQLKDKYHIIVKGHHGTDNLEDEKSKKDLLTNIADDIYPSTYPIKKLFEKCDVILSDNSGAVMDALYANIPVAISASEINRSIPGVDTLQYKLVNSKVIPYTDNPNSENITHIVSAALSKSTQKKQQETSKTLFPAKTGGPEIWFKIIRLYLEDKVSQDYCNAHSFLSNEYYHLQQNNVYLSKENTILKTSLLEIEESLNQYKNSRLHQLVNKLQHIIHKSE